MAYNLATKHKAASTGESLGRGYGKGDDLNWRGFLMKATGLPPDAVHRKVLFNFHEAIKQDTSHS